MMSKNNFLLVAGNDVIKRSISDNDVMYLSGVCHVTICVTVSVVSCRWRWTENGERGSNGQSTK
jgi:hypothetical protein